MAQIISGTNWAEQFGQGLGSGISQLAQNKVNQLQQRHDQLQKAKAYTGLGFSPEESQALASLPEKLQQSIVPAYLERAGAQQQQEQQQEAPIQQLLQQQQAGRANQQAIQQNMPGMPKQFQVNPIESALQSIMAQRQPQAQQQAAQQAALGANIQPAQQMQQQPGLPQQEPVAQKSKEERVAEHKAKRPSIAEVLSRPTAQQVQAQRKELAAQEAVVKKETQPYVNKITLEKDQADFAQPRLNKMKELIKKGKLPNSAEYKIFKSIEDHVTPEKGAGAGAAIGAAIGGLGGPVGGAAGAAAGAAVGAGIGAVVGPIATMIKTGNKALFATDEEAFEKLSAGFLRGMKDIFGARISNAEMTAYLASIPTLNQTDKGKLAVIEDMEMFNKAANIKYKAMQQIIKENGGNRPLDLRERVEERVAPQLNRLSDIFREDLS